MNRAKAFRPGVKTQTPPRPSLWLVFAGAVIVLVLAAVLFAVALASGRDSYVPEFTGGPRAQLSQTAFDYGNVKNNSTVETVFTIKNVGDRQLYFKREPVVAVVKGCCPPQAQIDRSELMPGESAEVRLAFSMHEGMDGPHDFRVKVLSNDIIEPEQEVTVLSNWVQ
jgi:hypothetical protein